MKIVVAVKQVPERDAPVKAGADGRSVDTGDAGWAMNEPDAYALEEALQLKERAETAGGSAEVIVLTAGPERAESTLREALAKGADRALHVVADEAALAAADTVAVAEMLAAAVKAEAPELVMTGLQSDDTGAGQTGVVMAELLGVPHTTLALTVELADAGIRVKREMEGGWFQHVTLPLPSLVTVQSGGNRLRYATLMGIKRARAKELKASEAAAGGAARVVTETVSVPVKTKQVERIEGTGAAAMARLAEIVRQQAGVR